MAEEFLTIRSEDSPTFVLSSQFDDWQIGEAPDLLPDGDIDDALSDVDDALESIKAAAKALGKIAAIADQISERVIKKEDALADLVKGNLAHLFSDVRSYFFSSMTEFQDGVAPEANNDLAIEFSGFTGPDTDASWNVRIPSLRAAIREYADGSHDDWDDRASILRLIAADALRLADQLDLKGK